MVRLLSPNPNESQEYAWLSSTPELAASDLTEDDEKHNHVQKISDFNKKAWYRRSDARTLAVLLLLVTIVVSLVKSDVVPDTVPHVKNVLKQASALLGQDTLPLYSPSATALPPALSTLPPKYKRITLIALWNNDAKPSYLPNYFRTVELNADVADLLVVQILEDKDKCFKSTDFGIAEPEDGGNVRILCVDRDEFLEIEAEALCAEGTGWGCSEVQHTNVLQRLREREDYINNDWKAMRGEMFRKYFLHPENPLWAWSDMDMHLGRLDHIPFSLLSTMSVVTLQYYTATLLFLPGQLTLFNMASPGLIGAWRNYAPLSSPEQFCKNLPPNEGGFAEGAIDESYLSAAYLRSTPGYAGQNLSWAAVPDVHGQDIFVPGRKFVISGRNVLEVDADLNREELEAIIHTATVQSIEEFSGWSDEAEVIPIPMLYGKDCKDYWFDESVVQCAPEVNLTRGDQYSRIDSARRGTVVRIAGDEPGQLHMHMEPDRRPRRWQRKLFLHYQEIKRQDWWWALPDYFIGDQQEVMEFDWKSQVVWKMGRDRETTVWERHNERLASDGTSAHTQASEEVAEGRRQKRLRLS